MTSSSAALTSLADAANNCAGSLRRKAAEAFFCCASCPATSRTHPTPIIKTAAANVGREASWNARVLRAEASEDSTKGLS
eukprot:CAMPEP_0183520446 /NCGR_PEP_ID=MMETSP0371-20130417/16926_1 /TAXON_ID=268820 /ORGANISM="Peridinium aciculiferum, Strain PAER-2" /LENGTH=79 /DNA_ID=CAMNT_0025718811 /DNA_START=32 /DNA_END=268 /DNA_ORIENTATION=-